MRCTTRAPLPRAISSRPVRARRLTRCRRRRLIIFHLRAMRPQAAFRNAGRGSKADGPKHAEDPGDRRPSGSDRREPRFPAAARRLGRCAARALTALFTLAMLGLAAFALARLAHETSYEAVVEALLATPRWRLLAAVALTAASFASLTLYDLNAFAAIGKPQPWPRIAPAARRGLCGGADDGVRAAERRRGAAALLHAARPQPRPTSPAWWSSSPSPSAPASPSPPPSARSGRRRRVARRHPAAAPCSSSPRRS